METPTSTGTASQPEPIKPWKQVAEESNIFSLPADQRVAEYDKWSQQAIAKGIRDGDFDSPDTFSQFKLLDIRTRKNLASDDIVGPSDEDILADYKSFKNAFKSTQDAFALQKPTPEDNAIQDEVLKGKRNAAFVRGQMVFNPTIVNDPQKYREAILESDAPPDIKMFYAGLRPEMEKSATVTRRRELANSVITRDVADKVVNAIQEGTEVFGADIGTPQSPALKKNKEGVWSVVDPEYVDMESSMLEAANARYNPLADAQYKPLAAINEYQKKYGLTDEQVQQDYMEALIENAPTAVNRWVSKATSVEDYVKQLDSTVRVKNKDVAPEVRVQDPNLFFDEEGYNAAVDKANAPEEAKKLAKEARTQFADAVAGDIYNNLLANRDDFRKDYAKDVVERKDMAKAITRYYKDKKDQAWYDDVGEFIGQTGTALEQGGMNVIMTPSAVLGMFGSVKDAEDVRYATMVQNGQMQAEEAVANRTGGAGAIKLTGDVARILPDLAVQMAIGIMSGGALSYSQAAALSARTGISRAAARTAIRQAMVTGEKAALKTELAKLIPNLSAQAADDVATGALEVAARTASNNPLKGGIGTQRAIGSAYAGLTSAGSTFGQVYTEVRAMGKSPEESIGIARTAGITAGAITGALTHTFGVLGRGGVEDFASMGRKAGEFTIRDIMKSGVYDVLTTQEGRRLARSIASGIAKDALHEGVEEGLDQALNLISQYATNPSPEAQNRKVSDVINESLYATLLGGIAGGGANVVGQARVTAPGITAQQMQAEILGANAPQAGAPEPAAPQAAPQAAPVVPPVATQTPVAAPTPAAQPQPAQQAAPPDQQQILEDEAYNDASKWDLANRSSRSSEWFEGGNANQDAIRGYDESYANGGMQLQAHGMAKEATLSGGVKNLISLLRNGLDPNRRKGVLDTAPLVAPAGAGLVGATSSGTAYRDGPFTLIARPGQMLSGDLSGLGAVVINQANLAQADSIKKAILAVRPDLIVGTASELGVITGQLLAGQNNTQPSTPVAAQSAPTTPPTAPVVQSADPVIQQAAETAKAITDVPDTSQTAAALEALAKAAEAGLPKPEFNLPVVEKALSDVAPNVAPQSDVAPAGFVGVDGGTYADTPRMREYDAKAKELTSRLPEVAAGYTRLWRGNRKGEVGKNPSFTNSLIGIALPFRDAYNGSLAYVDVPTADLPKHEQAGAVASGSEFVVTPEIAAKAVVIQPAPIGPTEPANAEEVPVEQPAEPDTVEPETTENMSKPTSAKRSYAKGDPNTPFYWENDSWMVDESKIPAGAEVAESSDGPTVYIRNEDGSVSTIGVSVNGRHVDEGRIRNTFMPSQFANVPRDEARRASGIRGMESDRLVDIFPALDQKTAESLIAKYPPSEVATVEPTAEQPPEEMKTTDETTIARDATKPERMTPEELDEFTYKSHTLSPSAFAEAYRKLPLGQQLPAFEYDKAASIADSTASISENKPEWEAAYNQAIRDLAEKRIPRKHEASFTVPIRKREAVSVAAVDAYGIELPKGYVKEGELYVFKGEAAPAAEAPAEKPAPYDLQIMSATTGEWRTVQTFTSKQEAEKNQPKGSGWRIQPAEKPVKAKQPKPTKPNAVQKPKPDEGVLRQERPKMGLPEVDQGGRGAKQESAKQAEEVKTEVPPEQQDVVVFMEEQNDEQEERQKPKKKRITPGEARKVGIAKKIEILGIQSNDPESVIAALKKIAAKPPQPHHARIAKDLLSVLEGSGTSIVLVASNDPRIKKGDERVNGWYDPATNTAYINLDGPHELGIEETILHELVHASGEKVIRNPQTDAQKRILGDLRKQMEAATKNAISLGQSALKTKETDLEKLIALAASKNNYALFDILYGVSSLSEYHAHATTSKAFQKFLSEYKEGSKRNFLERFVNSITSLLSGKKTTEGSDAEKSYATLLDLMRENKGDVRLSNTDVVQSRARGRFDLVDAVRAASSGDASTPFQALNEAINANTELTRRIQAESERRSRAYARGKGAILEQIIRAGNTGRLPQESIKPLTDFVNSVSAEALADTRISLSARPQNSTFDFTDSLVTLALNGLGSDPNEIDRTGVHEFWHGLSRFIPDDEIEKMRVDYVAAVKEYISENPWFVPFIGRTHLSETQYDELSRLLSKDEMDAIPWKNWETLDDGRRIRGIKWSKENYRLFRLDEWVAETMADLVRRKQERPTTILGKMARLFRDFIDTLKQALGNPYLRALDAMTMPDEAFDAVIQRYGPIEDNPPVMYGGPAVGVNNQFILGMYAGEKALENLPEEARAFKRDSLGAARAMAAAGKTSEEIRAVTGWFPGKYDGKMRWEIPDNEAELRLSEYRKERIDGKSAKEIVRNFFSNKQASEYTEATKAVAALKGREIIEYSRKFEAKKKAESEKLYEFYAGSENQEKNRVPLSYLLNHAKLFDAYPELKWIPVSFSAEDAGNDISSVGSYNPSLNIITLNPLIAFNDEAKALSTLLHEIQHAIQKIEGFAKGGNLFVATMAIAEKDIEVDAAKQALRYAEFKYKKLHREAVERLRKENGGEPVVLENERADLEPEVQEAAKELSRAKNDATYRKPAIAAAKVPEGDAFEVYQKIAGEIESRDIQARQSLTPEQRTAIAPYSSENIAPDDALVRFSKARGIVSDAVVKFAPQFNVVDAPDGPSVEFDGRSVTVNPEKLANLEEYEVQDLANRAVVAAIATPKDPIAAGIIQQTMAVEAYNFDSESRKGIRKSLADAHRTAHEFGMAPLAMELGNRLFEFGGATDADVRKSMARGITSDDEYADTYKRGDTEAAQAMVDEAARVAGAVLDSKQKPLGLFRGDESGFDTFNPFSRGGNITSAIGISLTPSRATALSYGSKVRRFYAFGKKRTFDYLGDRYGISKAEADPSQFAYDEQELAELIGAAEVDPQDSGAVDAFWDGKPPIIRITNISDPGPFYKELDPLPPSSLYIIKDGGQIKSADPFTFDEAGNLIPLSKRFQSDSPDIRYSRARGTELVTRVSGPALAWNKFISGFRSRGMVSQETYDAYRDSDAFKKENAAFVSFIAKDFTNVTNKLFGEGGANLENFRVFSRDATTGEATVSSRGFETRQKAEAFAVTNRYKDYIVSTGQDLINQALGSNGPTLKEDVRDAIEKLTKKGLDDIAKSLEAYKEEYLEYWNTVMMQTQPGMIDPAQIATLRDRKEQWMAALRLRSEEQKKLVDDARKKAVQAAIEDAKNRIVQQQQFAKAYLPDDLVHQIERAREKIDELSTRLTGINWLMEGSELQMVIEGLNGVYVTRSYEAFETSDKAKYAAWLNEAYNALTNSDQVYDPLAMERIMPLVRHIKNGIMERRIEDLKKENDQRQVDAIMEDLMADSRQVTQVDRIPGQPIEGTEYEQLIRAVAKRDLLRRRSDEKKRFLADMMDYLARSGFASGIANPEERQEALKDEANRIYDERYAEQEVIADMFGRPEGLQWAVMTDDEAHDIANVELAISEDPGNLSGSAIWTSSINGKKHSTFNAAVNDDFQENLNFILKAPGAKTSVTTATANDWKRLGDKILEHKNDVPAFLRTFLGEKDNPLLRVSDTIMKQSHLIAVGNLYQNIAKMGQDQGWLVHGDLKVTDKKYDGWETVLSSANADQGYENNPLKDMYADPAMAKAIDTLLAANQPSNSAFKVISFVVGASLWNVTAGSVRAIARNLYSLPIFLMNSGILGAVINPTRWPIVAKNIVLASRIVQQSMEATGKVSGGQQITNKGFKLADKFWTGLLSVVAAQRPALYAMRGAASMAEIVGRIKEQPTSEAFQEIYLKAVRLGVANDNVQKEAIHRLLDIEEQAIRKPKDKNMGRFAKALKLEGAVGFGSYLLGTMKSTLQQRSQLYGAPDDFTKIMAWLNEMDTQANIHAKDDAQYKEWVGEDGLFAKMPDEFVKKAADNVTNLIQSHSRVWAHITQFKKMGFGALMAPFAAARAEFYRNAANAYIIAFEEMRSKNKKEQMNGGIRFASALMAHLAMGNAIGAVVKTIFSAFADDDEIVEGSPEYREAVRKLGPEYAKNKNATYILYKNGTFDWVDLSFANPFAFVWDSITAARRGATEKDVEDNIVVAMSKEILEENIGTFAKPQIALDAFAAIRTGYDPVRGVKIWDSQADSFTDKLEKSVSYYLKQAGAPGDYKDAMKIWKASRGVEENGRQYKVGTEVGAVFLGTSIRTVNITDALEQKLAQAKDTLGTRITPLYKAPLRNANDVEMEDVALAVQQYAKAHDQAVSAMQKSYKAAETLLRETPNAKTLLRNVMSSDRVRMSQEVERAIVTGKHSFPEFSDQTLQKVKDLGKKHGDDRAKVMVDTLKEYNQKKKNP